MSAYDLLKVSAMQRPRVGRGSMFGLLWEYDSNLTGTSSAHDPCPNLTSVPTVPCTWMANVIDVKKSPDKKDFSPAPALPTTPLAVGPSHRAVLLWRHHSTDRTRRWSRHDRMGPDSYSPTLSAVFRLWCMTVPPSPPEGILRVRFLYPTVCRGLMAAKYSFQVGYG